MVSDFDFELEKIHYVVGQGEVKIPIPTLTDSQSATFGEPDNCGSITSKLDFDSSVSQDCRDLFEEGTDYIYFTMDEDICDAFSINVYLASVMDEYPTIEAQTTIATLYFA